MQRQSHFSFEHMDVTARGMQALEEALYSKDILFNLGCYVLAVSTDGDVVICKTAQTGAQCLPTKPGSPGSGFLSYTSGQLAGLIHMLFPSNGIFAFALPTL